MSNPRERQLVAAAAVAAASVVLTAVGAAVVRAHFSDRLPFAPWTATQTVIWTVAVVSSIATAVSGLWLVHRLPRNPTGWWVLATAAVFSVWMVGTYWPGPFSPWAAQIMPVVFTTTIVVAVLPWPTGRLERRWAEPFTVAVTAYVAIGVAAQFVGYRVPLWTTGDWHLPSTGDFIDGLLIAIVAALLLRAVAPAVFFAAVLRRHRMMPVAVRGSTLPAVLGAGLLALTELWIFTFDLVLAPLNLGSAPSSRVANVSDVIAVGRFGVIALLLVLAEAVRRRGARRSQSERRVELGSSVEPSPADEVGRLLGDPSAHLVMRADAESYARQPGRTSIELVDARGTSVAVIDHDERVFVTTGMRDALLAAVELDVIRRARQVEARARTADVQQVQRAVLDAQDRARHRLERDLHDGVQQRLVAVALEASMLARREQTRGERPHARDQLAEGIEQAIALTRDVMREGAPAVLDPGLAAALAALDSAVPIVSTLELEGDLPADHPAALVLWFVASEAVANTLKHAQATSIGLRLRVDERLAELTVVDDGVGGAPPMPEAIARRLSSMPSTLTVQSPSGHGTAVRVLIDLVGADRQ